MKISPATSRRGFAVIVALVAVAVLGMLAGALAVFMKVENQLAQNGNDDEKLFWLGRAGVERACWVLSQEPPGPTSLKQIWAGGPGDGPETNSPLAGITLDNFPVGDGTVSLKITELESRININRADTPLLTSVLTTMGVDAGSISAVSDAVQDWIDTDDATRPAGAESDYYQGQTPPFNAKNAPMDDIEELQLVKGVTPLMFKGGSAENPDSPFQHHKLGFGNAPGREDYPFGLRDVFTPFSTGKVNVNTADANVLLCLPGMDANAVQNILTLRTSDGGFNSAGDNGVIANLGVLQTQVGNPQAYQSINNYCSVRGDTYEVHATARVGTSEREFIAIVFRAGNRPMVVGFHPK